MKIIFLTGWFNKENDGTREFTWAKPICSLKVNTEKTFKYLNLLIGSPEENLIKIKYNDNSVKEISIKCGWHTYQIPYAKKLSFESGKLKIDNDFRSLSFMLSKIEGTDDFVSNESYVIENLQSKWIDIVYVLHDDFNSSIELITNNNSHIYPIYTGGERSISFEIKDNEIENDAFKFRIREDSSINLQIVSIINRKNFHDFLGLSQFEDESSIANRQEVIQKVEKEKLRIQWFVTWKCNMSCEYCWQESAGDIYRNTGGKTIKTAEEWSAAINRLNPSRLYLTGGEPSLYKGIPQMFQMLNNDIKLDMTSNFGKTFDLNQWKNLNPDQWNFIYFSLHPTQWQNIDDFFNKLEIFFETFDSKKVGIEMVLHPKNIELLNPNRIIEFSQKYHMAEPHLDPFVDSNAANIKRKYNSSTKKTAFKQNFDKQYHPTHITNDSGRQPIYCTAGWKRINVDFEGNAFTCMSAIDRSKLFHTSAMPHYNTIGNIFNEDFKIKESPIPCWESFRCSACDYQDLQHAWVKVKNNFKYQLPIAE